MTAATGQTMRRRCQVSQQSLSAVTVSSHCQQSLPTIAASNNTITSTLCRPGFFLTAVAAFRQHGAWHEGLEIAENANGKGKDNGCRHELQVHVVQASEVKKTAKVQSKHNDHAGPERSQTWIGGLNGGRVGRVCRGECHQRGARCRAGNNKCKRERWRERKIERECVCVR